MPTEKRIRLSIVDENGHIHYIRMPVSEVTKPLHDGNVMHLLTEDQVCDLWDALGSVVAKVRPIRQMRSVQVRA